MPDTTEQNRKWWQWILLYPALLIAVLTAMPQWVDIGQGLITGQSAEDRREAEKQLEAQRMNTVLAAKALNDKMACLSAPPNYYENDDGITVDGTICANGSVFLQFSRGDEIHFKLVPVPGAFYEDAEVVDFWGLGMAAYAALPSQNAKPMPPVTHTIDRVFASGETVVVCQAMQADNVTVLRHIKVNGLCYDEHWNTGTGKVTRSSNIRCRTSC